MQNIAQKQYLTAAAHFEDGNTVTSRFPANRYTEKKVRECYLIGKKWCFTSFDEQGKCTNEYVKLIRVDVTPVFQ